MSSDPISLINNVVKIAQTLRDVTSLIKDAETKNLIADLNLTTADLKIELAKLKEENLNLQNKLKELTKQKDIEVILEQGAYWLSEPKGTQPKGPYCTGCFDANKKLILLTSLPPVARVAGSHLCPNCQIVYRVKIPV